MGTTGRRSVVGVMGGAVVGSHVLRMAEELGSMIAEAGFVLLTGGRSVGVMEAASCGASRAGGLVVGVLPGSDPDTASAHVDIAIVTNLGDARNLINVLSSDVVVACPGGAGTLSEVALAIKNNRPVVLLGFEPGPMVMEAERAGRMVRANDADEVMHHIHAFLENQESFRASKNLLGFSGMAILEKSKD